MPSDAKNQQLSKIRAMTSGKQSMHTPSYPQKLQIPLSPESRL
jgi:hypothetical protein